MTNGIIKSLLEVIRDWTKDYVSDHAITVDTQMSTTSTNPVQNKVVTQELNQISTDVEEATEQAHEYADAAAQSLATMQSTLDAGIRTGIERGTKPAVERVEAYIIEAGTLALQAKFYANTATSVVEATKSFSGEANVPVFQSDGFYEVGDIVKHNGLFYRCTTTHYQRIWDPNDFVQTTLYDEIKTMKDGENDEIVIIKASFHSGTPSGFDFTTLTVYITDHNTMETDSAHLDENGQYRFTCKHGDKYTVTISDVSDDYFTPEPITHTAYLFSRDIPLVFYTKTEETFGVIFKKDESPIVETFGKREVLERILGHGTWVLYKDDHNNKYAAQLNPFDHTTFIDGITPYSGNYGNQFRYIPRVYFKTSGSTDTEYRLEFSDKKISDKYWEESWIGTYKGTVISGRLRSLPDTVATGNMTMTAFWNAARANGTEYGLTNVFDQFKLIALHAAYFGTRNSDDTMGVGLANGGYNAAYYNPTSGYTKKLGDRTGELPYLKTTAGFNMNKLFGIEALAGAQWEFRPNVRFTSNQIIFYDGNRVDNTATGVTIPRTLATANRGFITDMEFGDGCYFVPKAVGGGSSTHWCDAAWAATNGQLLLVGGASDHGLASGLSASASDNGFSRANAVYGARLSFRGDFGAYTEITGAEMEALPK